MPIPTWQLTTPLSAIVFDCDGTLSAIEGIDELAVMNKVGPIVQEMTKAAMGTTGLNPTLFQQRLDLVRPTEAQLQTLAQNYLQHQTADAAALIHLFQRLQKSIYIVSAGLNPAVKIFGQALGVPSTHIFAVNLTFDSAGSFLAYDTNSPLVHNNGKQKIVSTLIKKHGAVLHIGDGLNDYTTHDLVERFVGYGGIFYRSSIEELCQYYIRSLSLAALLPLALTIAEKKKLLPDEQALYQKGLIALQTGKVKTPH